MKLTESVLRQMVKEELEAVLAEAEEESEEGKTGKEAGESIKARIKKSQEERGVYGKADTGREYLKRLMKSASKKGSS